MGRNKVSKNNYLFFEKVIAIEDSRGNRAYIDYDDLYKVSCLTFIKDSAGYFRTEVDGEVLFLHNIISGNQEKNLVTDHINRCKLDNRKVNLRICSYRENTLNQKLRNNNTSGYTGVSYDKYRKKFVAYIGKKRIGRYNNLEEAINAREEVLSNV